MGQVKGAVDGGKYEVTTLAYQEFSDVSSPPPSHPVQVAYGTGRVTDEIMGCTFEVSTGSFFQVNTECADILYGQVADAVRKARKVSA